jgi:hypothetical protein
MPSLCRCTQISTGKVLEFRSRMLKQGCYTDLNRMINVPRVVKLSYITVALLSAPVVRGEWGPTREGISGIIADQEKDLAKIRNIRSQAQAKATEFDIAYYASGAARVGFLNKMITFKAQVEKARQTVINQRNSYVAN